MKYLFLLFMLACCYYSITYGVHLWKKEHNRFGGFCMITLAIAGTAVPAAMMLIKS